MHELGHGGHRAVRRPPSIQGLSRSEPPDMRKLRLAGVGVLATLVGMGVGHLVAALLDPAASPVLAVGSMVIDLTPTPVKEWAVAQFGTADKPLLIGSVLLGTLVLAGVAGVVEQRSFILGAILLLVLVGLAGAAALGRPRGDRPSGWQSIAVLVG
jgi:hypothetical protein